jgi:hypothetical protein
MQLFYSTTIRLNDSNSLNCLILWFFCVDLSDISFFLLISEMLSMWYLVRLRADSSSLLMMESSSPLKCLPSPAKRGRYCNIWSRCIICQKITSENLASSTEKGIPSFPNAVAQRQDELYRRLVQEFGSLENVAPNHIKYHKNVSDLIPVIKIWRPSLQAKLLRKTYL